MKLRDVKEWLEELPEEFLDFSVCNGEYATSEGEIYYRVDKPIITFDVDEKTKEVLFLHQTQDEVKDIKG